ncbi:MAG: hypothetical protein ABI039_11815 [Vicinamibacterales bacterium]
MRSKLVAGGLAGLMGGLVFGVMMQMMTVPSPNGDRMPMMAMVAAVVRSDSLAVGWLYHLFNSAVIGALFAVVLGDRVDSFGRGAVAGALWGVVWWVLGALILMPLLLGMPVFAALRMEPMRPIAMGSLVGHLLFGVILGLAYVRLRSSAFVGDAASFATRSPSRYS